jgi:hypothetical protein
MFLQKSPDNTKEADNEAATAPSLDSVIGALADHIDS